VASGTPHKLPSFWESAAVAYTPQNLQPGTTVNIHGEGFVPGCTVKFGNVDAQVAPTSVSGDGTLMYAVVPRLATTGPITVVQPSKRTIVSSDSLTIDSFRNTNGFAFQNFDSTGYSFSDFSHLFGWWSTYVTGWADPGFWLTYGLANNSSVLPANCFGVARIEAALMHNADWTWQNYPAEPGPRSVYDLVGPDGPSDRLRNDIRLQSLDQFSSQALAYFAREIVNHVNASGDQLYNEIHDDLAKGDDPIISLEEARHAVVAYDLEKDPSQPGSFWIDVYDSNRPFVTVENTNAALHASLEQQSRIHVDSDGNWWFQMAGETSPNDGGPEGLLVVPYNAFSYWDVSYPGLWNGGLIQGVVDLICGGNAVTTQVTDPAGRTLLKADGTMNLDPATRLPDGVQYIPIGQTSAQPTPIDLLDANGTYTQSVQGTGNGTYSDYLLGSNIIAWLKNVTASQGVTDQLTLADAGAAFQFHTGAASKSLDIELEVQPASGPRRAVEVNTTSFAGGGDTFAFDSARQSLTVTHLGAAAPLSLTFTQPDAAGTVETFATGPISLAAGDVATVTPANWSSLTSSLATLTITHADGTRSTTTLVNQLAQQTPITVHLDRVHGRPELQVFDAASGALKFSFLPFPKSYRGSVRFVVADLNWDGTYEIAVVQGKGGKGTVLVFDGKTGALRYTLRPFRKAVPGGVQLSAWESHGVWYLVTAARPRQQGKMVRHVFGGPDLGEMPANLFA
jgi:hypothetical protein